LNFQKELRKKRKYKAFSNFGDRSFVPKDESIVFRKTYSKTNCKSLMTTSNLEIAAALFAKIRFSRQCLIAELQFSFFCEDSTNVPATKFLSSFVRHKIRSKQLWSMFSLWIQIFGATVTLFTCMKFPRCGQERRRCNGSTRLATVLRCQLVCKYLQVLHANGTSPRMSSCNSSSSIRNILALCSISMIRLPVSLAISAINGEYLSIVRMSGGKTWIVVIPNISDLPKFAFFISRRINF